MNFDLNKYFLYNIKMVEISEENLNETIINEEIETIINEDIEPIKRGRGRPKKIKPIEEEPKPPKIRKKRIIIAEWRYKEMEIYNWRL